MKIRKRNGRK